MYVSDLTEFSDHCFLAISININNKQTTNIDKTFEIFNWESAESNLLLDALEAKREEFDSATEAICNDDSKIDGNIIFLTDVIYNACFSVFGRTVKIKKSKQNVKENQQLGLMTSVEQAKVYFYKLSVLLRARTRRKIKLLS